MRIKRSRIFREQFHSRRALSCRLFERSRKLLDKHCQFSYAQTGEDRLIEAILDVSTRSNPGFYVDVGCHHPIKYSNTYKLYRNGWRGITIDANSHFIDQHRAQRPRDQAFCALLSSQEQTLRYVQFADDLLSSVDAAHIRKWSTKIATTSESERVTRTLTDILDEAKAPEEFELLSIDVEGHDLEVLKGLNLERYRPTLIVVEMHDACVANLGEHPLSRYLLQHSFEVVGYALMNGYFRRQDAP